MRKHFISTLAVHRVLEVLDIKMSKKALQNHLDSNLLTCKDSRIGTVITRMIESHELMINNLKNSI